MENKNFSIVASLVVVVILAIGAFYGMGGSSEESEEILLENLENKEETMVEMSEKRTYEAVMKTNYGDIILELYGEKAPLTVGNFIKLANSGFYNGTKFHRVIKDFMIQGGDPNTKLDDWSTHGMGGPGYQFQDEINDVLLVRGVLAMANAGRNTNGSQFFIVTAESTPWLDGAYTAFGRVKEGMDVVLKIEGVDTDKARGDHPLVDVLIESISIK